MMDMDELEEKIDRLHFDPSNINITGPYRKLNKIRNETRVLSVSESCIHTVLWYLYWFGSLADIHCKLLNQ